MYFFPNIKTTPLAPQLISQLTKLYENKGKELYYLSIIKNDSKVIKQNVTESDAEYSGHLLHINLSNQKYKLLTQQSMTPNNRKEKLISNFLKFFQIMHKTESNWKLSTNGVIEIQEFIFREFDPNSGLEKKRNRLEKKNNLDNLVVQFNRLVNDNDYELINLFCAFTIDFINLHVFDNYNEFIGVILLMLLLKQYGYKIVDYISFFKAICDNEDQFIESVNKSSLNWGIGLPQYHFFTVFIIDILNKMYEE